MKIYTEIIGHCFDCHDYVGYPGYKRGESKMWCGNLDKIIIESGDPDTTPLPRWCPLPDLESKDVAV